MKKVLVDTNVLLNGFEINNDYKYILLSHVNRELEKHKKYGDGELKYKSRKAVRFIEENIEYFEFDIKDYSPTFINDIDPTYTDNKIVQACIDNEYALMTNDLLLKQHARMHEIELIPVIESVGDEDYSGVKELFLDPHEDNDALLLSAIYSGEYIPEKMVQNEYLVIWDKTQPAIDEDGEIKGFKLITMFKFNGFNLVNVKYKDINNNFLGKIKPYNVKQKLAFDLLQDDNIPVKALFGGFGVGKDFLMISHAINLVMNHKFEKILWVRNNVEVKDSNPIGFLPNSMEEKLLPFLMPLADHLGGVAGLEEFMRKGKVEVQHLGFMRGRDIKDSIIYVTECENNTKEHIQLLLGRVGKGSQLWLNGDTKQTDADKFKFNSGLQALKKLAGNKLYGQVTMDKTERSEVASLADLLD